jgi:acyl-CoA synthetase (AMP-forming)/AMP-acid ligase II
MRLATLPHRSNVVMRHLLERNAADWPDKDCVMFEDGIIWNYRYALMQAYKSANRLSEFGIRRGDHVLVFLPNGKEWLRAWWGISVPRFVEIVPDLPKTATMRVKKHELRSLGQGPLTWDRDAHGIKVPRDS